MATSRKFIVLLAVAIVSGLLAFYVQDRSDGIEFADGSTWTFRIVFGFAGMMFVMVCNWQIPRTDPIRTQKISNCLNAIAFDIVLLMLLSIVQFSLAITIIPFLKASLSLPLAVGIYASAAALVLFVLKDGWELRKIRSQISLEQAKESQRAKMEQQQCDFDRNGKKSSREEEMNVVETKLA